MYLLARRYQISLFLFLLGIPIFYAAFHYARAPELYAGDSLESRACRQCGGTGRDEQLALDYPEFGDRCPFCRGDGKVDVIVPGPNRPTRIRGAAVDAATTTPLTSYGSVRPMPARGNPMTSSTQKPAGAVGGAKIAWRSADGKEIETEANPYGLFNMHLPPGVYAMTVTAPGFATLEEELEVLPLTEPIWLEDAQMVQEWSEEEAQSLYGLCLLVGLGKAGEEESFLRVEPGMPGN
jgi:hypothetical protein